MEDNVIQEIVQKAIQDFVSSEQARSEPAHKAELLEERRRRENLERRVNELVEENKRAKKHVEETERTSAIRSELQRLGVAKIDLAFKAVQDSVVRSEDGRLLGRTDNGEVGLRDYLSAFVAENPELLPARIPGGSGFSSNQKVSVGGCDGFDLDQIRPGMSKEDRDRVREEIARVASAHLRGA